VDYQEKFMALKAISSSATLGMRRPGDWYVFMPHVEIGNGSTLTSPGGGAETPEAAIEEAWATYTWLLKPTEYLVLNAGYEDRRRHVRWNGFMWADAGL
jgi:hypothetical protein